MPRLFTGLAVPPDVTERLSALRGGMVGARWIDPGDYHVTLRFLGDVDNNTARDAAAILGEGRATAPLGLTVVSLDAFGGARPRSLVARIAPDPALQRLQTEQEKAMRRIGLDPETRKYAPHITLARFRDATASDVAGLLAALGHVPSMQFRADAFHLYSARDSVGGGPYRIEATYPLGDGAAMGGGQAGDRNSAGFLFVNPVPTRSAEP